MKKINSLHTLTKLALLCIVALLTTLFTSCNDDDDDFSNPEITGVSFASNDSAVVAGIRQNMYIIRGNGFSGLEHIYFNDYDTYFNPTYVTNEVILVTIDAETPYDYSPEAIRVVTNSGEATYSFDILQPAPTITSFTPAVGSAGTQVTIIGEVFNNLESVYFGDAEASIISSSDSEIVVTAPEIEEPVQITVTTSAGATVSEDFFGGLSYYIYDDALNSDWWSGGWGETNDFANTTHVNGGTYALETQIAGWSAFQVGNGGGTIDASNYSMLQFDVYAVSDGNILISMNYDYSTNVQVVSLTAGEWQTLSFDLSSFNITEIQAFAIQEYSGSGNTLYIDNLGFL
ncbi:IPT/TIG domain-containing protein [Pustulibacterium marinum]|uniref:IPT/TIG domain-containing protein n=1 Tax=Pustulibacterium marinum TaxID=1224947 RepID=A0A1I7GG53_9FLAO|nr:IPT/TIG domain-containing protein [Pustulibacterium marinum]SFU47393.1 IPT/TIG domain-containing protein [Pustulibacterium marinum]